MSTEALLPNSTPVVVTTDTTPARRTTKLTCGYCDCVLAEDGGVLRISDRVKQLNRQEETIENMRADVTRLQSELATATAELTAAREAIAAAQRKGYAIDWED